MSARPAVAVVDDSLTVRMDIGEALEDAGFETILCPDLRAARHAIETRLPALVVLDLILPDGDGLDLLKELKSGVTTADLPILLLSTEAEVASRVRGMAAGADEYVGKPYELSQVVARARALVQAHAAADDRRRVLVIDDSATFRHELVRTLADAGYDVRDAETGEEGLALAAMARPDVVIVDGNLPGIDGPTVIRRLKSDTALRSVPCILLTAAEDAADELRSLEAGADAHIRKREDLSVVVLRIGALLRQSSQHDAGQQSAPSLLGPKRLLAVGDSTTYLEVLGAHLREEGYDVVLARSGEDAIDLLAVQSVDCVLLDLALPGLSGRETCQRIKATPDWRDIPLMMLIERDDARATIESINAGAEDCIAKSADFSLLKARLRAQLRRKHFEDENRRATEERVRHETEARFQKLIRSDIIGMIVTDLSGCLTDANDAFLAMLGLSRSELGRGDTTWDVLTPPEWRERDAEALTQLASAGTVPAYEKEFFRSNGTRIPVAIGLVRLEESDRAVGFVLDRAEQRAAQQKIADYAAALEGANKELESFSYSVAHDLRAPLRSIDGFSQALVEDYESLLDAPGQKYLRYIRESASLMEHLIDDMLMLSRVTRAELRRDRIDVSEVVRGAASRLERAQPAREVTMIVQGPLMDQADPRLLAVAFDNLLGNAWKFTSKRSDARVEFGATTIDGHRVYSLRDNGAGFDMTFAHKLFGVFQRLHSSDEFEGTGIGLATVKRIIHRHGGRVWAEGEIGRGAAFYFTLGDTTE